MGSSTSPRMSFYGNLSFRPRRCCTLDVARLTEGAAVLWALIPVISCGLIVGGGPGIVYRNKKWRVAFARGWGGTNPGTRFLRLNSLALLGQTLLPKNLSRCFQLRCFRARNAMRTALKWEFQLAGATPLLNGEANRTCASLTSHRDVPKDAAVRPAIVVGAWPLLVESLSRLKRPTFVVSESDALFHLFEGVGACLPAVPESAWVSTIEPDFVRASAAEEIKSQGRSVDLGVDIGLRLYDSGSHCIQRGRFKVENP